MKLSVFNGGLNTKEAPELIASNEAVVCKNTELDTGQLAPTNDLDIVGNSVTVLPYPYYSVSSAVQATLGPWQTNNDVRHYLDYNNGLYFTGINTTWPQKFTAGTPHPPGFIRLGLAAPSGTQLVQQGPVGGLTAGATYQYVMTYYDNRDGTESMPCAVSAIATGFTGYYVSINTNLDTAWTSGGIDVILYRIGGSLLKFTEVARMSSIPLVANTWILFTDLASDASLAAKPILSSELNGTPPVSSRYLTELNGTFYCSVGSVLHYSRDVGNPNYWPPTNTINFEDVITAISDTPLGLLVCTVSKTYLVTGGTAKRKRLLDGSKGCVEYNSMAFLGNTLLFVSLEGVCALSGATISNISKFKLNELDEAAMQSPVTAVVYKETYYLLTAALTIYAFDFRTTKHISTYTWGTSWLSVANGILYGTQGIGIGATTRQAFKGPALNYVYTTGNLTEGTDSGLKSYTNVYLSLTGTVNVSVFIDNVLVISKQFLNVQAAAKPQEIKIPFDKQRGSAISFSLTGLGTVKEIEYKVEPRKNGR